MTISKEKEAEILRYAHAEKWRVGTIVRQLGVHHTTVSRVLEHNGLPRAERVCGRMVKILMQLPGGNISAAHPDVLYSRLYRQHD